MESEYTLIQNAFDTAFQRFVAQTSIFQKGHHHLLALFDLSIRYQFITGVNTQDIQALIQSIEQKSEHNALIEALLFLYSDLTFELTLASTPSLSLNEKLLETATKALTFPITQTTHLWRDLKETLNTDPGDVKTLLTENPWFYALYLIRTFKGTTLADPGTP